MRVAVVYFEKEKGKLADMAESLAHGIGEQGHDVKIINGAIDGNVKLTMYEYIAVGTAPLSPFSKKLNESLEKYIKNAGMLSGKRCYAFIQKKGFRSFRVLQELMNLIEREGVILKTSDVINSKEEASYIGKKLHITK
jgi:menaquinone-dependent protoporphyrinogen IX oxidase